MRKPKIYADLGISNDQGGSTWLIGKDSIEDIIKETTYKNLSIIPSGPIHSKQFELTFSSKTDGLLNLIKERFDCIIIDSPSID